MTIIGIIVSVIYIGLIVGLRWASLSDLQIMPLNEFGDFFAGVFGPLMLFWLILGYIQQQKELTQNTDALLLQAEELKKTVVQHEELVKVAREQMKVDIQGYELEGQKLKLAAQPSFSIISAGRTSIYGGEMHYSITFKNSGKPGVNLKAFIFPEVNRVGLSGNSDFSDSDAKHEFKFTARSNEEVPERIDVGLTCTYGDNELYEQSFQLSLDGHNYIQV